MSRARSQARMRALQALYGWQLGRQALKDIEDYFLAEQDMAKADHAYFHELLFNIPAEITELESHFSALLDRPTDQVDPVERAILWIATYEFKSRIDIPYKVVINEAVELAKRFGAEQGHRFINGILDKVAEQLRAPEVSASQPNRPRSGTRVVKPKATIRTRPKARITRRDPTDKDAANERNLRNRADKRGAFVPGKPIEEPDKGNNGEGEDDA